MSSEDRELSIPQFFKDYTVIEYLALLFPDLPRRGLRPLFADGKVRSGKLPVSPRARLGDLAQLSLIGGVDGIEPMAMGTGGGGTGILHEDAQVVVLVKDPGVPVVPDRQKEQESCLAFLLRRELRQREDKPVEEYIRPRVVHRIDRLTSGLVIFAKTPAAERQLSAAFEAGQVRKEYLAIVLGDMAAARKTISVPIDTGRKGRMRWGAAGKRSETVFEAIERFGTFTLVRALPLSGRTHQIRVHALAAGFPLAVDSLYRPSATGTWGQLQGIDRLTLHARSLELPGDWEGERRFVCEPPGDFSRALELLRKGSALCGGS
ncbi:MAG: RluA family pseudouridine synthase [Planctomycetota bacterium]|nr:RluA family pseudouridine synthase [Planctomycetota bacterium]